VRVTEEEMMDRLITPDELAEFLHRPKATLYAWRYRGEGPPAIAVGRELRYRESVVDAWLDRLAEESMRLAPPSRSPGTRKSSSKAENPSSTGSCDGSAPSRRHRERHTDGPGAA
jgi:predicted DNA-binding transcriptional regulator AlpA